jgi:CheY-like chemotaxis protein
MCRTRVLIADDEPDIRTILRRLLVREEFCVAEAGDGVEALSAAQNCDVQVIVMDINMPRMNGTEALWKLRELPRFARTPVVLMTGNYVGSHYSGPAQIADVLLFPKPLNLDQLLHAIQELAQGA